MKKKLALVYCVHHKPWLVMGSLVSALSQSCRDFDLIFLYQNGDGSCSEKESYNEYRQIARECGKNIMLSEYDPRVRDACKVNLNNKDILTLELENDQSLDSGAYYKFIKNGGWGKYDYVFFIQEGAIFTSPCVIESFLDFAAKNNVHFLSTGHEKQCLPKEVFTNLNRRNPFPSKLDIFHDKMIEEVFAIFRRDIAFEKLYKEWQASFPIENQHHIPDLGREYRVLNSIRNRLFVITHKIKQVSKAKKDLSRTILRRWDSLTRVYEKLRFLNLIAHNYRKEEIPHSYIAVNAKRRNLNSIVDFKEEKGVKFHKANDNNLQWFGCCCIHMLSNEFLDSFSSKLHEYQMFDMLDFPFSATALEVIWGFLPSWLGFDKWFFDGIQRPRKNFYTREWEDSPEWMAHYLNWFFRGKLYVEPEDDFIKIKKMSGDLAYLTECLNSGYFKTYDKAKK
jgi:hypothetical protein